MSFATLDLVLGATCLGKTRLAVGLAASAEGPCPVVALDRIQGHPELGIGSGRPFKQELGSTTRLYLGDGPLAVGPTPPSLPSTNSFNCSGGSSRAAPAHWSWRAGRSLLDVLLARPEWSNGWRVHVTVCVERSASRYDADVAARVERMLGYGTRPGEARTLQHELVALWDHPQARKHTAEVLGYQQAIDLCEIHGLPPQQLTGPAGPLWRGELAQLIHGAHLAYARQQRRALAAALPALNDIAERVELCET